MLKPLWCAITSIVPASLGMHEPEGREKTGWKRSSQPEESSMAIFHLSKWTSELKSSKWGFLQAATTPFLSTLWKKAEAAVHCHSLSPHLKKRKQMLVRASTWGRFSAAQVYTAPQCFPGKGFLFETSDSIQASSSDGKEYLWKHLKVGSWTLTWANACVGDRGFFWVSNSF